MSGTRPIIPVAVSAKVPGSGTVLDSGATLENVCGGGLLFGPGGGVYRSFGAGGELSGGVTVLSGGVAVVSGGVESPGPAVGVDAPAGEGVRPPVGWPDPLDLEPSEAPAVEPTPPLCAE